VSLRRERQADGHINDPRLEAGSAHRI